MSEAAQDDERAKLPEDPLEGEHLALVHKVYKLHRDRKVGHRNEEVAHELPPCKAIVDGPVHLRGE